jgi:hypothetical protein
MTVLDRPSVSRKTPLDGKLEISPAAASRLADLGAEFPLTVGGEREGRGQLQSFACTCAKAGEGGHVHYFVESPLLRDLAPGTEVQVQLDEPRRAVRVETAQPSAGDRREA